MSGREKGIPGYVEEYIRSLDREPEIYMDALPDSLYGEREFNIIYRVTEILYAHLYSIVREDDVVKRYIVIEPPRVSQSDIDTVVNAVVKALEKRGGGDAMDVVRSIVLSDSLAEAVYVRGGAVYVPERIYSAMMYHIEKDFIGLGAIEPLLKDPYIEDISIPGVGCTFIYHKFFGQMETNICFDSDVELNSYIYRLSEKIGRPVSHSRPIVDATLPDGSRINIVYGSDISLRGSNLTVRKFSKEPISVIQLIRWGTMSPEIASYLWMALREQLNIWICGETASGKTTTLNAIAVFIPSDFKIVSIEDTAEIYLPHKNWVRELARQTGDDKSSVTLFDLLRASLRQRPNYIIVGEVRGQEAYIVFQAMQTGHGSMTTFHAGSMSKLFQRITGEPISVPKPFFNNLNIAVFQSAVYIGGKMRRRVIEVDEILSYDDKEDKLIYTPAFTWEPEEDRFVWVGRNASYILEEVIGRRRGLGRRSITLIYDEISKRSDLLRILARAGVTRYSDVWQWVKLAEVVGIDEALAKARRVLGS